MTKLIHGLFATARRRTTRATEENMSMTEAKRPHHEPSHLLCHFIPRAQPR